MVVAVTVSDIKQAAKEYDRLQSECSKHAREFGKGEELAKLREQRDKAFEDLVTKFLIMKQSDSTFVLSGVGKKISEALGKIKKIADGEVAPTASLTQKSAQYLRKLQEEAERKAAKDLQDLVMAAPKPAKNEIHFSLGQTSKGEPCVNVNGNDVAVKNALQEMSDKAGWKPPFKVEKDANGNQVFRVPFSSDQLPTLMDNVRRDIAARAARNPKFNVQVTQFPDAQQIKRWQKFANSAAAQQAPLPPAPVVAPPVSTPTTTTPPPVPPRSAGPSGP